MKIPTASQMRCGLLMLSIVLLFHVGRAATTIVQVGEGGTRSFMPDPVSIQTGDTVEWDWVTGSHSATSGVPGNPDGVFDSGVHSVPFTFTHTFDTAGTFPYFCLVHGAMMVGTINVAEPTPTPSSTPTATATSTPTATATATGTATPTATATATATGTATPTATATAAGTATPTATATATAIPTATATATATPISTSTPTPGTTPSPSPAQALNIATRMRVETGSNVLIGGFIVTGNAPKIVVARGIGPSLADFGISDALANPTLELHAANGTVIAQNDDWQSDPTQAAQLTALGLGLGNPLESGLIATLPPDASYTAILAGKDGGTGVGLVEIYDTNQAADSQLANISTRGFVLTDTNVMIGGFILGGNNHNTRVVVRGIGPSLGKIGLSPVLADPTLELHDGNGALLITNDDWQDDPTMAGEIAALGLALQEPKESGIFMSLPPGAYTAVLAGTDGGTGIGLVEVYNVH
jgi:plastocyanin